MFWLVLYKSIMLFYHVCICVVCLQCMVILRPYMIVYIHSVL